MSPVELTDGSDRRGGGGGRGDKSYDCEKTWPSRNHQYSLKYRCASVKRALAFLLFCICIILQNRFCTGNCDKTRNQQK
jgi:hypothetical protein